MYALYTFLDDSNGSLGEAIGCNVMWNPRNVLDAIVSAEILKLFTVEPRGIVADNDIGDAERLLQFTAGYS